MKYIIMLMIVIGLALADFATGWIKAYCKGDVRSSKMRKGGLNKLAEIVVMGVSTMMWQRQEKKKSVMMLCPMYMLTAYSVRKQKESSI